MDLELAGKRAIVTGGSRGIGRAIAAELAAEGADVALVARDEAALAAAAASMPGAGRRIITVVADTADDGSVRAMVQRVVESLGGVDILVNAAARPASSAPVPRLAELTDDAMRDQFEVKVLGYLRCARAVAPHLVAQGWGRIINVSGLNARQSGSLAGSVRNVAVSALTKNLADELGPSGVNVTVVHPGTTVTDRLPGMLADAAARRGITATDVEAEFVNATSIGRLVTAAEIASVVAFLASPRSVAINGDAVAVGGGIRGSIYY